MRILVTGGAGFIGSHLVNYLSKNSTNYIVVLDDLSGGELNNIKDKDNIKFICGSITDHELVNNIFFYYKFDYVYHLAAYAAEGLSHFIRRYNYNNNLIGSVNLINASINNNVKCFIFTSSIAVYGHCISPMKESDNPQPCDPYGISKLAVEMDLKSAYESHGLRYIIFRPHNVYGENQNLFDTYRNVIGIFINQIMNGNPITIFGDGTQQRAFSYIDDIIHVIADSAFQTNMYLETFNIGGRDIYSINDLADQIFELFNKEKNIKYLPKRNEIHTAYCDHNKLNNFFYSNKRTSLKDGLKRMIDWAETRQICSPKFYFNNIEIEKNLPSCWKNPN